MKFAVPFMLCRCCPPVREMATGMPNIGAALYKQHCAGMSRDRGACKGPLAPCVAASNRPVLCAI